jgi:hypothetical protein
MANWDAERAIRHSLFAMCLKTLKTAKGSYWLELAWIWDRRYVRLGSAPNARVEPARQDAV